MAQVAMPHGAANIENDPDWKAKLNLPAKDTRIRTEVSVIYLDSLAPVADFLYGLTVRLPHIFRM